MNPLLSFWIKVQPLSSGFGVNTWKAISQSSAIATSSGDDTTVQRTTSTSSWAFDCINTFASRVLRTSSSWLLNPMISRMQDAPVLKPSPKALCEGLKRHPTRKVDAPRLDVARRLTTKTSSSETPTALQQSQKILQQQDYLNYQMAPPLMRRNSKEWVREYKKERIDKINYNNVFGSINDASNNEIPALPPPPPVADFERSPDRAGSNYLLHPVSPTLSSTTVADSVVSLSPLSHPTPSPTISNAKSTVASLSPNDVICGRGGKANTHPGNVTFREEAKKLRSWYESSSKSEKFAISSFLVGIVCERGGRFLKRDPERRGGWLEADGEEVRKKASQALREKIHNSKAK